MHKTALSAAARDAAIHKKIFRSGNTTLIISNEEMNDNTKIVKSLKESSLLIEDISKKTKNEVKEQRAGFIGMLSGIFGHGLLGNLLTSQGAIARSQGPGTIRAGEVKFTAGEDTVRVGQDF